MALRNNTLLRLRVFLMELGWKELERLFKN